MSMCVYFLSDSSPVGKILQMSINIRETHCHSNIISCSQARKKANFDANYKMGSKAGAYCL